jgi:hypothetical protein
VPACLAFARLKNWKLALDLPEKFLEINAQSSRKKLEFSERSSRKKSIDKQ